MSTRMTQTHIDAIVVAAEKVGFTSETKDDGSRRYKKYLKLASGRFSSFVYVSLHTGIDSGSGLPRYLKVAVHPDAFSEAAVKPEAGIEALLNNRTKTNFYSSSNWVGFPYLNDSKEPVGRCYKVETPAACLDGLQRLLLALTSHRAT